MEAVKSKMQKTVDHVSQQIASFRTGRANPSILAKIQVDYYGTQVPINQVGTVTVPENTMLQINVFDANAVQNVEKAISTSDLGLNPQTEGSIIRLRLPELTEERRKELVRLARNEAEDGRVAIRNTRRDEIDTLKALEKEKEITEDDLKRQQDEIQKVTDTYIAKIDEILKEKESEIMTI